MSEVRRLLEESCFLAEKVVAGSLSKQNYVDQNKAAEGKVEKLLQDVDNLQLSL